MTNEVAIKAIQDFIGWFKEDSLIRKALEMAIKALENHDTFMKYSYEQGKQDALSQEPTFDDECQKDMDEAWEQIQKKRKRIPVTLDLTPCDDAISRKELLKAIDTWDKFGCDADTKLVRYQDHYVPYIHYDDVIKCIKGMPSVTPKSIECDDAISRDAVKNMLWKAIEDLEDLPSLTNGGESR